MFVRQYKHQRGRDLSFFYALTPGVDDRLEFAIGRLAKHFRIAHVEFTLVTSRNEDELTILWSSGSALAVFKPAGVATQAPNEIDSLEYRLRKQLGRQSAYLAFPHRLDRPVSGVILVATTKRAANLLCSQFESRKVAKTYLACVAGDATGIELNWSDWIRKQADKAIVDVVAANKTGAQQCETVAEPLGYSSQYDCTWLRLSPRTGRMHQLRVQSAHRGHVILGDELYGWQRDRELPWLRSFHSLRIALHAETISFHEPKNGRLVTVRAPLDGEMDAAARAASVDLSQAR